jgi:hypothetical protein
MRRRSVTRRSQSLTRIQNEVAMTKSSIAGIKSPVKGRGACKKFLVSIRGMFRNFLTLFRGFTEEDACALLSAYGLHAFEVVRHQNSRANEQEETDESLREESHRKRIRRLPGPIPIGVHPDFTQANWTTTGRKQVDHPSLNVSLQKRTGHSQCSR